MQAVPIIITTEILIVKMSCLSNHLLSDRRFETVDSQLAQKVFNLLHLSYCGKTLCIRHFILSSLVKTQLLGKGLYFSYHNLRANVLRSLKCNGLLCRCTKRSISVDLKSVPDGESKAKFRSFSFRQNGK